MKKSLMRSSSTLPRAAFDPNSRSLLKNVSSFGFCCTVINWNLSKIKFLGRVKVNPNSYTSSFVEQRSIMSGGFSGEIFLWLLSPGTNISTFSPSSRLHPTCIYLSSALCSGFTCIHSPNPPYDVRFVFLFFCFLPRLCFDSFF